MLSTKIIGNKITQARKKINISQAMLAEQLFISPQAVGKWERGESLPDIIMLNRLAKLLEVDLNYFSDLKIKGEILESKDSHQEERQTRWNMSQGNWVEANFSGLKNLHEKFNSSNMKRCSFTNSNLSNLLLKSNNVNECNFEHTFFHESKLQESNLIKKFI